VHCGKKCETQTEYSVSLLSHVGHAIFPACHRGIFPGKNSWSVAQARINYKHCTLLYIHISIKI